MSRPRRYNLDPDKRSRLWSYHGFWLYELWPYANWIGFDRVSTIDLVFQYYEYLYRVQQWLLESPSGSHESILCRSAINRIFREILGWISDPTANEHPLYIEIAVKASTAIEHPLHTEIAIRACSSDNTSPFLPRDKFLDSWLVPRRVLATPILWNFGLHIPSERYV